MTPSEYRYQIEKIYSECVDINNWLLSDDQFDQFVLIAKNAGSGNLVFENWKIYLNGGGVPDDFFEWWMEYRPDKLEIEEQPLEQGNNNKSPFDAVKKNIGMRG